MRRLTQEQFREMYSAGLRALAEYGHRPRAWIFSDDFFPDNLIDGDTLNELPVFIGDVRFDDTWTSIDVCIVPIWDVNAGVDTTKLARVFLESCENYIYGEDT